MNLSAVDQIAKAVLYEGYMLYPYRPSSVKNRQRFNFGVLYPQAYRDAQGGTEPVSLRTECLLCRRDDSRVEVRLRFLQTRMRSAGRAESEAEVDGGWQEATEREVRMPPFELQDLGFEGMSSPFEFPADPRAVNETGGAVFHHEEMVRGAVDISATRLRKKLFRVRVEVRNTAELGASPTRDEALMRSLVSAHLVLGVERGEFVSLLEPGEEFEDEAKKCENIGVWPVLVGEKGQRDTLLASPIILYDYPEIAPESAGDLFDGTEIDEILSLRIMTLTDEEKKEVRRSDDRARAILERTENMPMEQLLKLHGTMRELRPVEPGSVEIRSHEARSHQEGPS